MNDQQKFLVQLSFEKVAVAADTATCLFYYRLFDLDPSMRGMFPPDLAGQGRKAMQILALALRSPYRLDQLVRITEALGRRLALRRMKFEHYDTAATALRWTLEQVLGEAFTPEVEDAWLAIYTRLAIAMQNAASPELESLTA